MTKEELKEDLRYLSNWLHQKGTDAQGNRLVFWLWAALAVYGGLRVVWW